MTNGESVLGYKDMKLIDTFVPTGVQARLYERLGRIPRQARPETAVKIEALWNQRNTCPEEEVAAIDDEMLALMLE